MDSQPTLTRKKAFKITLHKGAKLTMQIKKKLKEDFKCHYEPIFERYVCPIDNKDPVKTFLFERNINAELIDCFNLNEGKSRTISGIENKIHYLEKEIFAEEKQLICEIAAYDSNLRIYDFENLPVKENLNGCESDETNNARRHIETDFHRKCNDLKDKKIELDNLRCSLKNCENEDKDKNSIIECLYKNEIGDAEIFVRIFSNKYIVDQTEGRAGIFYIWNGTNWEIDRHKQRYLDFDEISKTYLNLCSDEMIEDSLKKELLKRAKELRTDKRRKNVFATIEVILSFKGIWDQSLGYLPCANGVIELTTGNLLPHSPDRFLRTICPTSFVVDAKNTLFDQFLDDITLGNNELKSFLASILGGALIGDAREERVYILYGEDGRNGKGTLMQALERVLGIYAKTFPSEMLLFNNSHNNASSPSPELVALQAVRIAIFSEINKGRKIDSSKVKNLSGRDTIPCRSLYSNVDKAIKPSHTMFIQTNFKPEAPPDDNGFWKRILIIPFQAEFVEKPIHSHQRLLDPGFKERLFEERESILAWLIKGCLQYQATGLNIPTIVSEETKTYREENDYIAQFLKEICIEDPVFSTEKKNMQMAIQAYCKANEFKTPKRNDIHDYLKRKYKESRSSSVRYWIGVKIKEQEMREIENL